MFHRVAATPVLSLYNTDAAAFDAIQTTGEEFDFSASSESLDVLLLVHGRVSAWCVSDGHFVGFCFKIDDGCYQRLSDDVAPWASGLMHCKRWLTAGKIVITLLNGEAKWICGRIGRGFGWCC